MQRILRPEILDSLPADAPGAQASRRDLRRIDWLMGNTAWLRRAVRRGAPVGQRGLDLGAGDGRLARVLHHAGWKVDALDRVAAPDDWPTTDNWRQADITQFSSWSDYGWGVTALFLHHFEAPFLAHLGRAIDQHWNFFAAAEPLRTGTTQGLAKLVCHLLRAHTITHHDSALSVQAGFRQNELRDLLELPARRWEIRCRSNWRGAYHFTARRRP